MGISRNEKKTITTNHKRLEEKDKKQRSLTLDCNQMGVLEATEYEIERNSKKEM